MYQIKTEDVCKDFSNDEEMFDFMPQKILGNNLILVT